jgi:molecular chaperone GrpE
MAKWIDKIKEIMADNDTNKNAPEPENEHSPHNGEEVTAQSTLDAAAAEVAEEVSELDALNAKLREAEKLVETYKDQLLRRAAEFDNYKRRTERESRTFVQYANEQLITDILPALDDFARSLQAGKEQNDFDSFYKGVELTYTKLIKILETRGVKVIESVGKPFDVHYHEAIMQMPKEGVAPNIVLQETERGYMLNEKVIRHAKVIVSSEANNDAEVSP